MRRWIGYLIAGVDYLAGHREELERFEETPDPPAEPLARAGLESLLPRLPGLHRRLRAGWAAVRWLEEADGARRWVGPAFLYAFDAAEEAGRFRVSYEGEDPEPWEPPEGEAGEGDG